MMKKKKQATRPRSGGSRSDKNGQSDKGSSAPCTVLSDWRVTWDFCQAFWQTATCSQEASCMDPYVVTSGFGASSSSPAGIHASHVPSSHLSRDLDACTNDDPFLLETRLECPQILSLLSTRPFQPRVSDGGLITEANGDHGRHPISALFILCLSRIARPQVMAFSPAHNSRIWRGG